MTLLATSPAAAVVYTYGFSFTSSTDSADSGNAGNNGTYSVKVNGVTLTATVTAWNATLQTSGSSSGKYLITSAFLGQYKPGLGVTSAGNDDLSANNCGVGECGTHQIDNMGNTAQSQSYDFLQISFSQAVTLGSVARAAYGTSNAAMTDGAWDDDFSYGTYTGAASNLTLTPGNTYATSSLANFFQTTSADNGGCAYNSSYYCTDNTTVSNASQATANNAAKNWYIGAAIGSNYGGDNIPDAFKLQGVNAYYVAPTGAVPEPTTWAMMLIGFGAIGHTMRRKSQPSFLKRVG